MINNFYSKYLHLKPLRSVTLGCRFTSTPQNNAAPGHRADRSFDNLGTLCCANVARRWKRQKTQPELGRTVQPCKPMRCTRRRSSHLPIDQRSKRRSGNEPRQGEATEMTPRGGTHPCSNKPSRCSDRRLAISCAHHQAAGLQRTREITPSPHDLLRKPIEGAAREAQGQTHRVRAAIGSGEDSNTRGL